ncbi:MAG: hypothetical protein AAF541_15445 [Pseudomonadota bacterium]
MREHTPDSGRSRTDKERTVYVHDVSVAEDPTYNRPPYSGCMGVWMERALCEADPQDLVILSAPVSHAYLEYLKQLTGGLPALLVPEVENLQQSNAPTRKLLENCTWMEKLKSWSNQSSAPLSTSYFKPGSLTMTLTQRLRDSVPDANWHCDYQDTDLINTHYFGQKSTLQEWVPQTGLNPIPSITIEPDKTANLSERITQEAARQLQQHTRVMVKANYASNGAGNFLLTRTGDLDYLRRWLTSQPKSQTYVLEAFIESVTSPNVQFNIGANGGCRYLGTSVQRFSKDQRFIGNDACLDALPMNTLLDQAWTIAEYLGSKNVRGVIGLDFLVLANKSVQFVEVNVRYNGSTYAKGLVEKLNRARMLQSIPAYAHWRHLRADTKAVSDFESMIHNAGSLLMDYQNAGVVPFVPGLFSKGVVNFVTVGDTQEETQKIEQRFLTEIGASHA